MKFVGVILLGIVVAACEAQAPKAPDGPPRPDAGPDGPPPGCGLTMTGAVLDWDSVAATPTPIAGATLTDRDDTTRTTAVGADGAFSLCIPTGNFSIVDVAPGGDALPVALFANEAAIGAGGKPRVRTMSAARVASFFTGAGGTYDATVGQVLVHFTSVAAGGHQAAVANTPGLATQAFNNDAWGGGDTGEYVFFGNVALGTTANTLVTSNATGVVGTSFPIPLTPGTISYVELYVP